MDVMNHLMNTTIELALLAFGLGVICGVALGVWLVFKRMRWLVKWGLVEEGKQGDEDND